MTTEHIIGELYIKNLELYKAHQSLLVEHKNLQQELNVLQSILATAENARGPATPYPSEEEVALADPNLKNSKDSQDFNGDRNTESR